jgi:trimethylamine--corrinoid protein Co-methyltransferase
VQRFCRHGADAKEVGMYYDSDNRFFANPLMRPQVLSDADVEAIHRASVQVLSEVGLRVESEEAARLYLDGGADVTQKDGAALVKIPERLLEQCIGSAAKDVVFYGRVEEDDFFAGRGMVGFSTFGECVRITCPKTGSIRATCKQDLADVTKICDAAEEIAVVERACGSLDFPPSVQPPHNLEVMLRNTSKAIFIGAFNRPSAETMVEMARIAAGGDAALRARPFLNFFVCPVSPLTMGSDCCEVIVTAARAGIGIAAIPMPLAGATAPVTLAGTAVTHNCEALAALVLDQLASPGARFCYCSMGTIMDLRCMLAATGAPEHALLGAAAVRMAERYGLPSWIGGGVSDGKLPDAQAGYEFAIGALMGALAGANVIYGAGALESCLRIDLAKLVLDCEALRYVRRLLGGIRVEKEALAFETIAHVGPMKDYLGEKHTARFMRDPLHAQVHAQIFERNMQDGWEKAGALRADERALARAQEILAEHQVKPLPPGAEEAIAACVAARERALGLG